MKINIKILILLSSIFFACGNASKSTNTVISNTSIDKRVDTIRITNGKDFDYTFFEEGFNDWVDLQVPQDDFYESSLEIRNLQYVNEWNRRVVNKSIYNSDLYSQAIVYKVHPKKHYGMNVNYKLYQYFKYFELKHEQLLDESIN